MCIFKTSHTVTFAFAIFVAFFAWHWCHADDAKSNRITLQFEEIIEAKRKEPLEEILYGGQYHCTTADANGKRRARLETVLRPLLGKARIEVIDMYAREGEVIPFFGRVCEVGEVAANSLQPDGLATEYHDNPGRLHLRVLTDEECVAKLGNPNSAQMVASSIVVLVGARLYRDEDFLDRGVDDHLRFKTLFRLRFPAIHVVNGCPICELQIDAIDRKGYGPNPGGAIQKQVVKIGVGDTFVVPGNVKGMVPRKSETWRVKDIVVPDPKKRVIGWVSLDPDFDGWPHD